MVDYCGVRWDCSFECIEEVVIMPFFWAGFGNIVWATVGLGCHRQGGYHDMELGIQTYKHGTTWDDQDR